MAEGKDLNLEVQREITKVHKEAVSDLVVNKMVDGIRIDRLAASLSCLFSKKDEADVFSLALQKGGLKSAVMAGVVAAGLVGVSDCNLISPAEKK